MGVDSRSKFGGVRNNGLYSFLKEYGPLSGFFLLVILASLLTPKFLGLSNLRHLLFQFPMLVLVTIGVTAVIVTKHLDISTGAMTSLSGVLAAKMFALGFGTPATVTASIGAGIAVGILNGFFVSYFGIDSLITTFATAIIIFGIIFALCGGSTIVLQGAGEQRPFLFLGEGTVFGGIPFSGLLAILLFVVLAFVFYSTRIGWHLSAIGDNRAAARLFSVRVRRITAGAFVFCGFYSSLAGLILASRIGGGSPIGGEKYTLDAIAAVFVGSAFFGKGTPNPAGSLLGAMTFVILENVLSLAAMEFQFQSLLRGIIVILAIVGGGVLARRKE